MPQFKKSSRVGKKYMVMYNGDWIHFGDSHMEQYRDSTGLGLYSHLDHGDEARRRSYVARAMGIRDGKGRLTWNNPYYANYYSINYLW